MKCSSRVSDFDGRIYLKISGESDHENSLLNLMVQNGNPDVSLNNSAGTHEPETAHMELVFAKKQPMEKATISVIKGEA